MRRLMTVILLALLALGTGGTLKSMHGFAQSGSIPVPRAKPKTKKVQSRAASRRAGKPPLPRPKPSRSERSRTASQNTPGTNSAVVTSRGGRVEVALPGLGRERDPDKAANLKASEKSSWSSAQVADAKRRCQLVLAATNVSGDIIAPIGGSTGCGIAAPIKVRALGAVAIKPPATINCTLAAALYKWVTKSVQPAAVRGFKQPIRSIRNISSYSCRSRRGVAGGRISEHSFGNALDIHSFALASGERIDLLKDWNQGISSFLGVNKKGKFLSSVHAGACEFFATALGPNYNKAHANHFHFDLGRAGRNKNCK